MNLIKLQKLSFTSGHVHGCHWALLRFLRLYGWVLPPNPHEIQPYLGLSGPQPPALQRPLIVQPSTFGQYAPSRNPQPGGAGTSKAVGKNEDNSMPGTSYTPVPSKSTEMATNILQQLEIGSKGEIAGGKSRGRNQPVSPETRQQRCSMDRALRRSLEDVDSSNSLRNAAALQCLVLERHCRSWRILILLVELLIPLNLITLPVFYFNWIFFPTTAIYYSFPTR